MRRPTSVWTTAILGTAVAATTLSAQQPPPADGRGTPASIAPMSAARATRHLLRNGWDFLTYQEYDRALAYFREAEHRQAALKDLNEAELQSLKVGIERAQRGMRDTDNGTGGPSYAKSGPSRRPGALAAARPAPDPGTPAPAPEPIQLTKVPSNAAPAETKANFDLPPLPPKLNSTTPEALAELPPLPPEMAQAIAAKAAPPAPLPAELPSLPAELPPLPSEVTPTTAPKGPAAPAELPPLPSESTAPVSTKPSAATPPARTVEVVPTAAPKGSAAPMELPPLPSESTAPVSTKPSAATPPAKSVAKPEVQAKPEISPDLPPLPPQTPTTAPAPIPEPPSLSSAPPVSTAPKSATVAKAADPGLLAVAATPAAMDLDSVALPPLSSEAASPAASAESGALPPLPETAAPAVAGPRATAPEPDALPPLPEPVAQPPARSIEPPPAAPAPPAPAAAPVPVAVPSSEALPPLPAPSSPAPAATVNPEPRPPLPAEVVGQPPTPSETLPPLPPLAPVAEAAPGPKPKPKPASARAADSMIPQRGEVPPSTLSPELQREVEEIAQKMDEESRRNGPPGGPPQGDTPAASNAPSSRLEISRAPSPTEARPIRAIPVPDEFVPFTRREWDPNRKYWAAAATCHLPLYFQDASLERYGHSVEQFFGPVGRCMTYPLDDTKQSNQRNQIAQPFFSIGLFMAQIALLPYNMLVDPPWEAEYDLGYYRPGDRVPTDMYYLPLTGVGPPLRGRRY